VRPPISAPFSQPSPPSADSAPPDLAQRRLQGQPCASGAERAHRHQSPFRSPLTTDHRDEQPLPL